MLDYINSKTVVPLPEAGITAPSDDFQTILLDELRRRTELHHDDDGELVAITLDGEKFHLDELIGETPDEIVGTQEELDITYGHEDAFEELREYLEETGVQNITKEMMTEENLPDIAWDDEGVPMLHGDEDLEKKLGLPDDVEAVMTSNGVVVSMFHPGLHGFPND